ncbi:MAG: T9SS type A sorting domain-containing protein [Chitinophagales bacterium]|nr:T9SS type A sorting domain-containing protein [Chitinophagales bacterium]
MKKENSTLQKKLIAYSAIAAAIVAAGSANAQVVYHDVNPDKVLDNNNETQKVDLNGDGTNDFQVKFRKGSSFLFGFALPYSSNSVAGSLVSFTSINHAFPYAIDCGEVINSNMNWFNVNSLLFSYNGQPSYLYYPLMGLAYGGAYYYNWAGGIVDASIGVRLVSNGDVNYGWIRCDYSEDMKKLTVKDWAYEKTPNKAINACSSFGTGIPEVNATSGITIYSFEKRVTISTTASEKMNIVVTDMAGKTMLTQTADASEVRLDLNNLSNGMYLVAVTQAGELKTNLVSIR